MSMRLTNPGTFAASKGIGDDQACGTHERGPRWVGYPEPSNRPT
jgi:hypothetical protein